MQCEQRRRGSDEVRKERGKEEEKKEKRENGGSASKTQLSYEFFRRHMTWNTPGEISAPRDEAKSIILTFEERE
jgi:hypothetical protein